MQEIKDKVERQRPILVIDEEDQRLSSIVNGKLFPNGNPEKAEGGENAQGTTGPSKDGGDTKTENSKDDTQSGQTQSGASDTGKTNTDKDDQTPTNGGTKQSTQGSAGSTETNQPSAENPDRQSQGSSSGNSGSSASAGGSQSSNGGGTNGGDTADSARPDSGPRVTPAPPRIVTRAPSKVLRCIALGLTRPVGVYRFTCEYNCVSGFCPRTMCYCTM
ncbi:hypothetical protein EGW08_005448 [Elysia chlorotica]|uniref:Uncharacterized protein n=1 Tax=Elysia chlorotica TaxID=188477 RepID=A0A3S1HVA8_ELYCH|nr:hypothetical protein EGW08_005448 [Elysia chlorotica]